MSLSLREQIKFIFARAMIALGKLRYDDFSESELNPLLAEYLPLSLPLTIPIGKAQVTLLNGNISLDAENNRVGLQLLASLSISVAETTIYRAHVIVTASACPQYDCEKTTLGFVNQSVDNITLVNDDYALIKDTQFLLTRFFPDKINSLFGQSLKSALSLVTIGTSNEVITYLNLFLSGSKQAVLDYHTPQLSNAILNAVTSMPLHHTMRDSYWREALFARYGKSVRVEENALRFYF